MKFETSTFIEDGTLTLKLNGEIVLKNSGKATLEIKSEKQYEVSWIVEGKSGTSYTISISAPPFAEFHLKKTIGNTEIDTQSYLFEI